MRCAYTGSFSLLGRGVVSSSNDIASRVNNSHFLENVSCVRTKTRELSTMLVPVF